jgi:hypothetical protein
MRAMNLAQLARWLNERRDNCERIAASKQGYDRAGWLDDMAYFSAAIELVDAVSDGRLAEPSNFWRPIETAPRDGTAVDLWVTGEAAEVEFYCPLSYRHPDRVHRSGRVTNVRYIDGDWRPVAGLHRLHGLGTLPISILYWRPLPDPPPPTKQG